MRGLVLVAGQPLLQVGQRAAGRARLGLGHQPLEHRVEVEVPQRPVEVVGAADRTAGLHAGVAVDGVAGHHVHQAGVGRRAAPEEQLGELLGRHALAAPPPCHGRRWPWRAALAGPLASASSSARRPRPRSRRAGARSRTAKKTSKAVSKARQCERRLHQRGGQRVLERLAVLERDVLDRLGRVEVLGQRDREAGAAQLGDEPGQQVEHAPQPGDAESSSLAARSMSALVLQQDVQRVLGRRRRRSSRRRAAPACGPSRGSRTPTAPSAARGCAASARCGPPGRPAPR